jgi:hypothetical protein
MKAADSAIGIIDRGRPQVIVPPREYGGRRRMPRHHPCWVISPPGPPDLRHDTRGTPACSGPRVSSQRVMRSEGGQSYRWPESARRARTTRTRRMSASVGVPASITTPDRVPSRLGTLEFNDGAPTPDTAERPYHNLDFDRPLLRPPGAGRKRAQLDRNHPRQGLVPDPAPLQPAPAVLRHELAAERDRTPQPRLQRAPARNRTPNPMAGAAMTSERINQGGTR